MRRTALTCLAVNLLTEEEQHCSRSRGRARSVQRCCLCGRCFVPSLAPSSPPSIGRDPRRRRGHRQKPTGAGWAGWGGRRAHATHAWHTSSSEGRGAWRRGRDGGARCEKGSAPGRERCDRARHRAQGVGAFEGGVVEGSKKGQGAHPPSSSSTAQQPRSSPRHSHTHPHHTRGLLPPSGGVAHHQAVKFCCFHLFTASPAHSRRRCCCLWPLGDPPSRASAADQAPRSAASLAGLSRVLCEPSRSSRVDRVLPGGASFPSALPWAAPGRL